MEAANIKDSKISALIPLVWQTSCLIVEMQQVSCNLQPPDQGYLIINVRVGAGGGREGGSGDATWILIHHNVRDKLPWWLHTINYTNCPTVRPWRRPWSLLVLIKKHWNKTGWSSSPYNHSIRTFKLADSWQRKPNLTRPQFLLNVLFLFWIRNPIMEKCLGFQSKNKEWFIPPVALCVRPV